LLGEKSEKDIAILANDAYGMRVSTLWGAVFLSPLLPGGGVVLYYLVTAFFPCGSILPKEKFRNHEFSID
jgi:hypothetical protein